MKNPVYETMTHWKTPNGYQVRVRRKEPQLSRGPDKEVMQVIDSICAYGNMVAAPTLIERIAELPRISAIEILDPDKNGAIFYPDWK